MKWIVITTPEFINNEATYINQLFEQGIDLLHLRKPDSKKEDCERLIREIDEKWRAQIVIHDHFDLCKKYRLHGIHLNRRNHAVPQDFKGSISCSCHSLEEVANTPYDYVFLSPIFDSISKEGYNHAFSNRDLEDASQSGIINDQVIALGGISLPYIPQLRAWNFGGAAFLGDIWKRRYQDIKNKKERQEWLDYLSQLKKSLGSSHFSNKLKGSNVW